MYGEEPWTCSREYWRLYFGMECAELPSFSIRGLQDIAQPRGHRVPPAPPKGAEHKWVPPWGRGHGGGCVTAEQEHTGGMEWVRMAPSHGGAG